MEVQFFNLSCNLQKILVALPIYIENQTIFDIRIIFHFIVYSYSSRYTQLYRYVPTKYLHIILQKKTMITKSKNAISCKNSHSFQILFWKANSFHFIWYHWLSRTITTWCDEITHDVDFDGSLYIGTSSSKIFSWWN